MVIGNPIRNNGHGDKIRQVVRHGTGSSLAQRFIEPPKTYEEAAVSTRISDPNFANNITQLKTQMDMFNNEKTGYLFNSRIDSLRNLLAIRRSLNGIGLSLASMTDVDIYFPAGAGIDSKGKSAKDEIKDMQKNYSRHDNEKGKDEEE
jgi:hypothetical protein